MKTKRLLALASLATLAVLALGAASSYAHGGPGGRGGPGLIGSREKVDLITPSAKTLGISVDTLKKAILDVANAKIDAAVKAEKIDEDDAADLKDDLANNPQLAIQFTSATAVAAKLGTTKAKLEEAFRAARKAAAIARIDQAVKNDRIDADDAADLKAELEDADFPGYKLSFFFGRGFGGGHGFAGGFSGPRI
jgi:hypothetical protein